MKVLVFRLADRRAPVEINHGGCGLNKTCGLCGCYSWWRWLKFCQNIQVFYFDRYDVVEECSDISLDFTEVGSSSKDVELVFNCKGAKSQIQFTYGILAG